MENKNQSSAELMNAEERGTESREFILAELAKVAAEKGISEDSLREMIHNARYYRKKVGDSYYPEGRVHVPGDDVTVTYAVQWEFKDIRITQIGNRMISYRDDVKEMKEKFGRIFYLLAALLRAQSRAEIDAQDERGHQRT